MWFRRAWLLLRLRVVNLFRGAVFRRLVVTKTDKPRMDQTPTCTNHLVLHFDDTSSQTASAFEDGDGLPFFIRHAGARRNLTVAFWITGLIERDDQTSDLTDVLL